MTPEQARKKIIFAMDVNGLGEINRWSKLLTGKVGMFKVGKELFTSCGPDAVRAVQQYGGEVFLDLKYHDIPNTVAKASIEAARMGVKFVDMHALGGAEMMSTAAEAVACEFGASRPKLLAITILTSSTGETLKKVGIDYPVDQMVVRLAKLAQESGMDGVVCSPLEIGLIREACGPDFLIVTPGVRPSFASVDDQKRIMTPAEAVRAGADYLVIGRPISAAADPVRAAEMIVEEIAGVPVKDELVFGVNPVREALRGGREVFELYVQSSATDHRMEKIISLANQRGARVIKKERDDLTRMCASSHHQGMALRVAPFMYAAIDDIVSAVAASGKPGLLLLLDGIQDPHNLGALIRSAACAGANGVIIPKDRACGITAVAEQSSAGAVETIQVAQVVNMAKAMETLKQSGYWIYGLDGQAPQSLYDISFSGNVAIVIGGEGEGIRPLVRKQCDLLMSIPQYGGVGSLNASVAGGIALFEVVRGLHLKKP